jgi:hypothetical protein
LRALELVQYFVPCIDTGPALVLAQERDRIRERTNHPSVTQQQFWLDEKLGSVQHSGHTPRWREPNSALA